MEENLESKTASDEVNQHALAAPTFITPAARAHSVPPSVSVSVSITGSPEPQSTVNEEEALKYIEEPEKLDSQLSISPMRHSLTPSLPSSEVNGHREGRIDEMNGNLTISDSPIQSHHDNAPVNFLEDEIVVGTNTRANGHQPSPPRVNSDFASDPDEAMEDAEDYRPVVSHYPKRKRTSLFEDLSEEKIETRITGEEQDARPRNALRQDKTHGVAAVKGVILGYWRESPVPNKKDKHAVIGFIDVCDRLRTRIHPMSREGKDIASDYPIPPGPGGSWVVFDKIAFDAHLVGLDQIEVKEYVKIRAETTRKHETPEAKVRLDKEAVTEAERRLLANPPPEGSNQPLVAYGPVVPEHALASYGRREPKKRRTGLASSSATLVPAGPDSPTQHQLIDDNNCTKPTRVTVGYWKQSSEVDDANKHAVMGVLGKNGMFRVKLTQETRDGRPLRGGNFPLGAGSLWIPWDEVIFEPHLKPLTRPEIKEYCRVRQLQIDRGETPKQRAYHETLAVSEAQARVKASGKTRPDPVPIAPMTKKDATAANGSGLDDHNSDTLGSKGQESRQPRRKVGPHGRNSLPENRLRASNRPQNVERTHEIARAEIARVEAVQMRADLRAANHEASTANRALLKEHAQRLNKVWISQETNRLKGDADDAKIHMGVKYERKHTGPFEGKLVSHGQIISIDGEDYVEYRVLAKPSFS